MAQHRQSEQRRQIARAEQFACNRSGRRDGGEPSKAQRGGENVEIDVGSRGGKVDQHHRHARGVESEQNVFAQKPPRTPARKNAARDVRQTDNRNRSRSDRSGQAAERDFVGQVGHQKRDVETAGKKAQVQQDVAAVFKRRFDCLPQRLPVFRRRVVRGDSVFAARQPPRNRQDQKRNPAPNIKRPRPADGGQHQQTLHQRRKQKLPRRTARVDQPRSQTAFVRRHFRRDLSHDDGETARTRSECKKQPDCQHQPPISQHLRHHQTGRCQQQRAAAQHLKRAETVGKRAGKRLGYAPYQLENGNNQAELLDAQLSRVDDRTDKQPHSHAHTDGNQQDGGGSGDNQPKVGGFLLCVCVMVMICFY